MKEFKDIFKPEIQPAHKVEFSISANLTIEGSDLQKDVIPAGTLLKLATGDERIEMNPTAGVKVATVSDIAKPLGILLHDVNVADGKNQNVGIMIKGVVYDDVCLKANTSTNWTTAMVAHLLPHITTYKVGTLK